MCNLLCFNENRFAESKSAEKQLRIVIPESLDYNGAFDDIFEKYTSTCSLERVKTTNLGSMFDLTYIVKLKKTSAKRNL